MPTSPANCDPSNALTHLIIYHGPALLAGLVVVIGGTMLLLKKLGFLVITRSSAKRKCGKDGAEQERRSTAFDRRLNYRCDHHEQLQAAQIKMIAQQKVNTDALANGKEEFKKIKDRIDYLRIGVAVLLDRSGGKPAEWQDLTHPFKGD